MSTRKQVVPDPALAELTTTQLLALAVEVRAMWRHEVANGRMPFEPARLRDYDATIKELQQLHRGG